MDVLISYDAFDEKKVLKSALMQIGFKDTYTVNGNNYPLPESTLIVGKYIELKLAINAFDEVVRYIKTSDTSFEVTKFVAVQFVDIETYHRVSSIPH